MSVEATTHRFESVCPVCDEVQRFEVVAAESWSQPLLGSYPCPAHHSEYVQRRADQHLAGILPPLFAKAWQPQRTQPLITPLLNGRNVYLWGEVGRGKTYTAAALLRHFVPLNPATAQHRSRGRCAGWYNTAALMADSRKFDDQAFKDSIRNFHDAPVVVLDDLGKESRTSFVDEVLFGLVNHRVERGLPMIVTSNFPGAEIAKRIDPAVASRVTGGAAVVEVKGKDRRLTQRAG